MHSSVEAEDAEAKAKGGEVGKKYHASISRLVSGTYNPEPVYPELKNWE